MERIFNLLGTLLKVLPKVLPLVPTVVKIVERMFGGGKGPEKRGVSVEILLALIMGIEGITGKDLVEDAKFAEALGYIVDSVVAALNTSGAFRKENL